MPGYKTHLTIGLISFILLIYLFKIELKIGILMLPIVLLYSVLPDIDHWMSKIRKIFYLTILSLIVILIFVDSLRMLIPFLCVLCIFLLFTTHRKWFHTTWAAIILSLPLLVLGYKEFFIGLFIYEIHIIIDNTMSFFKKFIKKLER